MTRWSIFFGGASPRRSQRRPPQRFYSAGRATGKSEAPFFLGSLRLYPVASPPRLLPDARSARRSGHFSASPDVSFAVRWQHAATSCLVGAREPQCMSEIVRVHADHVGKPGDVRSREFRRRQVVPAQCGGESLPRHRIIFRGFERALTSRLQQLDLARQVALHIHDCCDLFSREPNNPAGLPQAGGCAADGVLPYPTSGREVDSSAVREHLSAREGRRDGCCPSLSRSNGKAEANGSETEIMLDLLVQLDAPRSRKRRLMS